MDPVIRRKIWVRRIGFLVLLAGIGVIVYVTARVPSTEDMVQRFEDNREVFAELREMAAEDGETLSYITYDSNQPVEGLSKTRAIAYRARLQKLQALSLENLGECGLWITAWAGGALNKGERYAYYAGPCTEGLGPIVSDLDDALEDAEDEAEAAGDDWLFHIAFKPLDNTWALVQEVER
jgi:hypothetical protein